MKYRTFGKTGWNVSEIGFGGWQLGGTFGPIEDQESIHMLLHAWEQGINFVDTAQMYGKGRSEEVIGRALKQWNGDHIYVATKVQPTQWPRPNEENPSMDGLYNAQHLREQCEASLSRLGVEAIDLYQLHGWFPDGIRDTQWYDTLQQLKKEGKIRELGVSIRDYRPLDGVDIANSGMIAAEQVVYNLFEQRPHHQLFPACRANQVAVIARVPFDESALVGNWTADTNLSWDESDMRRRYFKGPRFMRTLEQVEKLKATINEYTGGSYASLAEVALRFCLSHDAVSVVIPGMKTMHEVDLNVAVSDGNVLPDDLIALLAPFEWPRNYHNPDVES
jgi:aryl-alcohol dehydrogenase-like predicted oxidoreductase